jgi:predicted TIM-barrel fold metal-dependent hydrolase
VHPALEPFAAEARALRPPGAEVLDVHTHLGLDEDGRSMAPEQLLALLDEAGAARACVFPLHDPERRPAYRVPNDRVLEWAGASERLIPFCRLDPADGAAAEAERCLARGARGIKLHPRAQAFAFEHGIADDIFGVAADAGVPVLVHAGRGMPPIADGLCDAALRRPDLRLILAHAAVADQAVFTTRLAEHPGVLYDTACFGAQDLLELMSRVPPERIAFGSDPPYGVPITALFLALRCARAAGYDEDAVRALLGRDAAAALDGAPARPGSAVRAARARRTWGVLGRIANYGLMAMTALWVGNPMASAEHIDLALAACRDPDPGGAGEAVERAATALTAARAHLRSEATGREAMDLVFCVVALALTEPVGDEG